MEMAPEMTRVVQRNAKNGVVSPLKRFDATDHPGLILKGLILAFRCPADVHHLSGYFVEKARK